MATGLSFALSTYVSHADYYTILSHPAIKLSPCKSEGLVLLLPALEFSQETNRSSISATICSKNSVTHHKTRRKQIRANYVRSM